MERQKDTVIEDQAMPDTEEKATRPVSGMKRAGGLLFKLLLLFGGLFLVFVLGLSLFSSLSLEGMQAFRQNLDRLASVMMVVRLAVIAGVIGFWRPLNVWLAMRKDWPQAQLQRVLAGRWLTLGVLLFVELVLIQRLHEPLIDSLRG